MEYESLFWRVFLSTFHSHSSYEELKSKAYAFITILKDLFMRAVILDFVWQQAFSELAFCVCERTKLDPRSYNLCYRQLV